MASQRLTIVKIAGVASAATLALFRRWRSTGLIAEPNEWSSEHPEGIPSYQWPEHVRQHADRWALNLQQNGHKPPVLFFADYIDLWSFCPPRHHIDDDALIQVVADQYELFCIPLPIDKKLAKYLKRARRKGQWDEDRFFAMVTLEAIGAWGKLLKNEDGVVVFLRQVFRDSVSDDEVLQSLKDVPGWMGGDLTSG